MIVRAEEMAALGELLLTVSQRIPDDMSVEYLVISDRNGKFGRFDFDRDAGQLVAHVSELK